MIEQPLTQQYFDEQFESLARAVKGGFDHVEGDVAGLKGDVAELKIDVAGLKGDVAELKIDVAGLKGDVAELKIDVTGLKGDVAELKVRMRSIGDEVLVLSANMVTKQYLDAKIDQLIDAQRKDTLFKRLLLLALEEAHVLTPETRSKLEHLIPAVSLN